MALIKQLSAAERDQILAQGDESHPFLILCEMIKEIYDKETEEVVMNGQISRVAKKDFRFKLGTADCARKILRSIQDARERVKNQ